jgi:hypothetical protein
MKALLIDGPADGQTCDVPDSLPSTLLVEVLSEDTEETAQSVPPGEEFPTIESDLVGYRLRGPVGTQIGGDPKTMQWHARYVCDEALNPERAEHTVSLP